jgi:hypothetical protein
MSLGWLRAAESAWAAADDILPADAPSAPTPPPAATWSLPRYRPQAASSTQSANPARLAAPPAIPGATFPNCRYGAALTSGQSLSVNDQMTWLSPLGVGWYNDFLFDAAPPGTPAEHATVIYTKQNKSGCTYLPGYYTYPALTEWDLGSQITARPGALWLVGNEPDRGPNPEACSSDLDDIHPSVYAQAYHDVYRFIKQHDPTARVANAGLVQFSPGRRQYLDLVWQAYRQLYGADMPVDAWNMHLYVLPEADYATGQANGIAGIALGTDPALAMRDSGAQQALCATNRDLTTNRYYCWADHDNINIFRQQVHDMRAWMQQHGQQNKPLIISEYSLLLPYYYPGSADIFTDEFGNSFTPARVTTYLQQTAAYLATQTDTRLGYPADGYHLAQQWLWFSVYYSGAGSVSNLVSDNRTAVSPVGTALQGQTQASGATVNLFPTQTYGAAGMPPPPGQVVTATLLAEMRNNGNTAIATPFTVTFYADSALQQLIASTVVTQGLRGCVMQPVSVVVSWAGLAAGTHAYWVRVDASGVIMETNESDNVLRGTVFVGSYGVALPLVFKP